MPATRVPASDPSTRWRSSLPRLGSVRNRTGAVPGRRPTNSPPFSEGSLFMSSYVRSYRRGDPSAAVQRVEQLRVSLVDHIALDLQRRRQLACRLGEVVVENHKLLDLLDLGVFGVDMVDFLLNQRERSEERR